MKWVNPIIRSALCRIHSHIFKWCTFFFSPGCSSDPVGPCWLHPLAVEWVLQVTQRLWIDNKVLSHCEGAWLLSRCLKSHPNTAAWTKRTCWILTCCWRFAAFDMTLTVTHNRFWNALLHFVLIILHGIFFSYSNDEADFMWRNNTCKTEQTWQSAMQWFTQNDVWSIRARIYTAAHALWNTHTC